MSINKVALFTNEYPPHVYGGAGVHVEYLSRALAELVAVEVRCFGEQDYTEGNLTVRGYQPWEEMSHNTDSRFTGALGAFSRSLAMAKDTLDADVVHCHTWYTQMGGLLAGKLWDIPFVLTTHSLEPLRPWKAEQLGPAYHLSSWMERTAIQGADAVIAVSRETRKDVFDHFGAAETKTHVIHNGIDLDEYRPTDETDALERYGVDPAKPFVLFVGRITRQKGIIHLVDAIPDIDPRIQVVLLAGAPDTVHIAREMKERVARAREQRAGITWVDEMVSRRDVIQFYSHATVFACPSVYEPFGIINLEAMACETPVVASRVGGIPEVVVPDETGVLVDLELEPGTFSPKEPEAFSHGLAAGINRIAGDRSLAKRMGEAGRKRAEEQFSWRAIAKKTLELYEALAERRAGG
ncbi:MAG: glycogen synthase [Spirochaetes bacterium]|jgi:glycogen synthase|nr:glycogen synthase [Spirochaetota bacterium]